MAESPESAIFLDRMCDPRGTSARPRTHAHSASFLALVHTRAIKSNGVCPVAGRESPLMSGSHNDIISVDGACWGILFHTIGMLQTSTQTTQRWWWQKSVLTPDLLVDAFDKKQHVDSSPRHENCNYFKLGSGFLFFSSKDRNRWPWSEQNIENIHIKQY